MMHKIQIGKKCIYWKVNIPLIYTTFPFQTRPVIVINVFLNIAGMVAS